MNFSTPQNPLVHFEHLLQLITYGLDNPIANGDGYKAHFYDVFHQAAKNYNKVFFGGGNTPVELHCICYDENNPFTKFPIISQASAQHYSESEWKKFFHDHDLISKLPHERIFMQLEFKNPFLIKNEIGEVIDMVYAVGVFARNITIDQQPKIALSYGLLHVSLNDKKKLDYDIMHSMHLLSITNKKTKIHRCDFNFKVTEYGDEPVSELESYILTRLGMIIMLKNNNINHSMIEGLFKTSRLQGNPK